MMHTNLTGENPSPMATFHRVAKGNCVAVRRGGEQPLAKDPSQIGTSMPVNSIRPYRLTSLLGKGEVPDETNRTKGGTKNVETLRKTEGGWSGKGWKVAWLSRDTCPGAEGSRAGVRASIVAMKRVTTVEPREAGR